MTPAKVEYKRLVEVGNFSVRYNTNVDDSSASGFVRMTHFDAVPSRCRRWCDAGRQFLREFPTGFLYAAISGTLFGVTSAISKYMSNSFAIDPIQLALFRFGACVVFAIPHAAHSRQPLYHFDAQPGTVEKKGLSQPAKARLLLYARGLLVAPSISLTFDSLRYLPLSETTVLFFTSTLFTALLAKWILKEPFPGRTCLAIFLTFLGVILFAKIPVDLKNASLARDILNYRQLRGCGEAIGGAFLMSWVYILARSTKTVHQSVQVFHYALVASLALSLMAISMGIRWTLPPCGWNSLVLLAMLVASFYGQYCVSKSLRHAPAGPASLTRASFDMMVAYVFQVTFFREMPDWYGIGGTVCIFTSLFCMYSSQRK